MTMITDPKERAKAIQRPRRRMEGATGEARRASEGQVLVLRVKR